MYLRSVLPRLRCNQCGAKPSCVTLIDDPKRGSGDERAWHVVLLP
jgi:hypothetical protein